MTEEEKILARIEALAADENPLSWGEAVEGFLRSAAAGPTFNTADNIEAYGDAAYDWLFNDKKYSEAVDENLDRIRAEQARFKERHPYSSTAVEVGTSFLNPVEKVAKGLRAGNAALRTVSRLVGNPATQGALASAGAADGEDTAKRALYGGMFGLGTSAVGNVVGRALQKPGQQADRLKLSAYGIRNADVQRQIKKMGSRVDDISSTSELPIIRTLEKAERAGLVNAGDDVLVNAGKVLEKQGELGDDLSRVLSRADDVLEPMPDFSLKHLTEYLDNLEGTARETAELAGAAEYEALIKRIGPGELKDLQRLKVGLNYKWDQNPYTEGVIKALRSDLREEIEQRVNTAARAGGIDQGLEGSVRALNGAWGELAELKDVFVKRAAREHGGDLVEDLFTSMRTSGGTGTLNIAAAQGSLPAAAASLALNAARADEGKSAIADALRTADFLKTGKAGDILEAIPGRAYVQGYEGLREKEAPKKRPSEESVQSILSRIESLASGNGQISKSKGQLSRQEEQRPEASQAQTREPDLRFQGGSRNKDKPKIGRQSQEVSSSSNYTPTSADSQSVLQSALFTSNIGDFMKLNTQNKDLILDAVREVESGGGKYLTSSAGAKGAYQFMPATAKAYGVDPTDADETDDRLGAEALLRDEQKALGTLQLALAAYNAGRPAVLKAIKKAGTDDWEKVKKYLPKETREYIPKIFAAMQKLNPESEVVEV